MKNKFNVLQMKADKRNLIGFFVSLIKNKMYFLVYYKEITTCKMPRH